MLTDLASKISTDISSLGVDTATDSSEESDSGATESVSGDELEKEADGFSSRLVIVGLYDNLTFIGKDDDFEDEESETDEDEAEDLASLEGSLETSGESVLVIEVVSSRAIAEVGGLDVGDGSDSHADETSEHGSGSSNDEGDSGEWERSTTFLWPVDSEEDHDGEEDAEDGEVKVFFEQECVSSLIVPEMLVLF